MTGLLRFVTADVFTDRAFAGNPLAVVLDGRGLTPAHMQTIAREFNFSETTFVLPADNPVHTFRVRIFTPGTELPFAGHPTIGTAWVLSHLGRLPPSGVVFEEGVGPVPIDVTAKDGKPSYVSFTTAIVPQVGPPPPGATELAAMLQLAPADVRGEAHPMTLSCGTPYTCVPLGSVAAVDRARLDLEKWGSSVGSTNAHKVFVFTRTSATTLHARMFAPAEGVVEDPATGSAACAMAGWLVRDENLTHGTGRWTIHQGVALARPSLISIEADVTDGKITAVRCGGTAVIISEGELRRPD